MLIVLSYLLAAICIRIVASEDTITPSTCTPSLQSFTHGKLTKEIILELAEEIKGAYESPLKWLSQQEFFPFTTPDNLTLQAYAINVPISTTSLPPPPLSPILIYCAGWTETTIKYSPFLQDLAAHNYTIYSFDFRGQGFSQSTGYDLGVVTHIESFNEYISDLHAFTNFVTMRHGGRQIVYIGNSLSGLVGLKTQAAHAQFQKVIVAAPVVKPTATLNTLLRYTLRLMNDLGFGKRLIARLGSDISDLKLTHNAALFNGWQQLRTLAPRQLIVSGPSLSWLSALTEAGNALLAASPTLHFPLLVFTAEYDLFVDTHSIFEFAERYGGSVKLVKVGGAWHEVYLEEEEVYRGVLEEILEFIRRG